MASKKVRGITIEIGGDTTKLGKALDTVTRKSTTLQSELKEIDKGLKFDPSNVELLSQKQTVLTERIESTSEELRILKEAEAQVIAQFERGEIAEDQVRALQREIITVERSLGSMTNSLEETNRALDNMSDGSQDSSSAIERLNNTIAEQEDELTKLRDEYANIVLEQGNSSEEAQELASRMRTLNDSLGENKQKLSDAQGEANELADSLGDVGDTAGESSGGFTIMKGAIADLVSNAIQSAVSAIGDFIGSLFELSEATEEYRTMQSKLEGSANSFGYSVDFAKDKYQEFYSYLGDDQMATNAITNLMGLETSTESLTKLAEGAIGVWASYGDSIPIESLTESMNETIAVGKVTGTFADTINWATNANEKLGEALAGNSEAQSAYNKALEEGLPVEDAFNEALAKITDEQERADVVAQFLNSTYGESKQTYDELSGSITEANEAELALKDTQAELGEVMSPLNTAITNLKNQALEALVPVISDVVNALLKFSDWLKENPVALGIITGLVTALATAFTIFAGTLAIQGIINGVTMAMSALGIAINTAFLPVTAIIALIAGLVAGFIYLWNNCDAFREFWINLWENIKTAVSSAVDWISGAFDAVVSFFQNNWQDILLFIMNPFAGAFNFLYENFEGFRNFVDGIVTAVKDFFVGLGTSISETFTGIWTSIVDSVTLARDTVVGIATGIWASIVEVFTPAIEWFSALFQSIHATLSSVIQVIIVLVTGTWEAIKAIFAVVSAWFSENVIEPVKNAFTTLWTTIGELAGSAWAFIVQVFTIAYTWFVESVVTPISTAFSTFWTNITTFASNTWNGIKNVWSVVSNWFNKTVITPVNNFFTNMWNKLKAGASGAWSGIKSVFSHVTSWFRDTFSQAWTAVKNVFSTGGRVFTGITEGITSAFKTVVNAIIGGINRVVAIPFNAINGALGWIRGATIAGITPFAGLPTISVPQIPLLYRGGILKKGQMGLLEGDGAEAVVPLEKETGWIERIAQKMNELQDVNPSYDSVALASKMDEMISTMKALKSTIVLDTGVLVGETINQIDEGLGNNYSLRERRV